MYTPRAFAESDLAALDRLVERDPFISLTTVDGDGLPFVNHLPVLYSREGGQVLLEGHWARPNPQAKHAGPALAIVHGPHAYISPGWYPDKKDLPRVPTWNYAVAHLYGTLETFDDSAALADLVDRLSLRFEASVGSDWRFEHDRADHMSQLRGIVGFRFRAERIALKFKLNQNHPEANVRGAAAALNALPGSNPHEVAALMLDRLARRTTE